MWRWPACQTLSKALDISSTTVRVAPDLLKALAILSDTTIRRSAVDHKDLKPYWKSEKRPHFSKWSTILLFTSFSDFNNHRENTNRWSNDHKDCPNQHKNSLGQWNKASCYEYDGKSLETETTTWSEFPNGGKDIVEQILASEEINISKRAGLWESQSEIWVEKLTIWVRPFEKEKL